MNLLPFAKKTHLARYASPAVYYTFAFSLPPKTDIYKLADRLLQSDLATAALSAGSENVRFAQRFDETLRNRALAESVGRFVDVEEGRTKFLSWARNNPKAAAFLLRRKMLKLRRSRRGEKNTPDKELLKAFKELAETADSIKNDLANAGLLMGSVAGVDGKLFSPRYLNTEPFIRLELDTLYVESDDFAETELVIFLLLHRSGVALITIIGIPGECSTDELLKISAARKVTLKRTALPAGVDIAIADVSGCEVESSALSREPDAPMPVTDISWKDPLPLEAIFEAYAHLTCVACDGNGDYGDWICYTTVFVDGLLCCNSQKQWRSRHAAELAGLIRRDPGYATTKPALVLTTLGNERGQRKDESTFFTIGNAISINWTFDPAAAASSPVEHFYTTTIIESVLIQYWKLYSLELALSADKWTLSNLASIQRQLITGIEEYRSTKLVAEEARWIERDIAEKLELDRISTFALLV